MRESRRLASKARIGLVAALVAGLVLRLYPLMATGMPFDNDSWYIHGDIRVLRRDPAAHLLSNQGYDGYNNYWPGAIITPYTLTLTTGNKSLAATHLTGPLLDALALIPFYTLARRLTNERAWQATLIVAAAPSMVGLGLGLVKETVARPLFYSTLLAAVANLYTAIIPLSLGLAMTHHLTSTITALILIGSPILATLLHTSSGARFTRPSYKIILVAAGSTIAWLLLIPPQDWRKVFTLFDPFSLGLYMLAFTLLAPMGAALIGERPGFASKWIPTLVLLALILVASTRGLSPGVQALEHSTIYYMAPIILLAPLVAGALSRLKQDPTRTWSSLPYSWTFPLAGLVAYLTLTGVLGQSPAGRVANLALPGLALLYAYSGSKLLDIKAIALLIVGALYIQALLSGHDPEAFDLPYHEYELAALKQLHDTMLPVYTDAKMRDPARYLGLDPQPITQHGENSLLVIYKENLRYGYKLDSNLHTGDTTQIQQHLTLDNRLLDTGRSWITLAHS